jgi:hypothetical protein
MADDRLPCCRSESIAATNPDKFFCRWTAISFRLSGGRSFNLQARGRQISARGAGANGGLAEACPHRELNIGRIGNWAVCEPRHTHARTFALHPPIAVGCLVSADASERRVSHANAMRRIPRPWLAMGFRRDKGVDLFDCGPVARTRLGKRAGVRPRFIRNSSPHLNLCVLKIRFCSIGDEVRQGQAAM